MDKPNWINRLQDKWNLKSSKQVAVVLLVFALTGTTVLLIKRPILGMFSDEAKDSWLFSLIYFIFILPLYNIILLFYGFILGQFSFFLEFEKKTFRRIANLFKK